jgi:hypothetical protein
MQRSIAKEQKGMQKGMVKELGGMQKNIAKNQKAMQRSIAKQTSLSISKEGRVPVKAELRKKVYKKCNDKCHYPRCVIKNTNVYGKVLQIHHIDMNNTHTFLSNLELLCPTHHKIKHNIKFRKIITTGNIMNGFRTRKKLITKVKNKELNRKKAKQRRINNNSFGNFGFGGI